MEPLRPLKVHSSPQLGSVETVAFSASLMLQLTLAVQIGQVPGLYWVNDFLTPYIGNHLGIAARHGMYTSYIDVRS